MAGVARAIVARVHRSWLAAALCLGAMLTTSTSAWADESCAGIPEFGVSLARFRYAANAPAPGELGMDFEARALTFAFTSHRCSLMHSFDGLNFQAPDFGDGQSRIYHFLGYRLGLIQGDVAAYLGVRLLSLVSGELSFVTPTAGVRYARERLSLTFDVEVPGLYAFSLADRPRMALGGARVSARAMFDISARTRLEGRARWRNFNGLDLADDVTLAAGLGAAIVARDGMRGMPSFLGLGVRTRSFDTTTATQFLLLVEFDMAAIGDWPP